MNADTSSTVTNPAGCCVVLNIADAKEVEVDSSFANDEEADVLKILVKNILASNWDLQPTNIAVITAYSGQKKSLQSWSFREGVEVDTVDAFQGQEREVIVLSTVRNNGGRSIGFLDDYRRVNVSITRARRALLILGNAKTLMHGDLYGGWKSLLQHLYHQNSLLKVFKMDSGDLKYVTFQFWIQVRMQLLLRGDVK